MFVGQMVADFSSLWSYGHWSYGQALFYSAKESGSVESYQYLWIFWIDLRNWYAEVSEEEWRFTIKWDFTDEYKKEDGPTDTIPSGWKLQDPRARWYFVHSHIHNSLLPWSRWFVQTVNIPPCFSSCQISSSHWICNQIGCSSLFNLMIRRTFFCNLFVCFSIWIFSSTNLQKYSFSQIPVKLFWNLHFLLNLTLMKLFSGIPPKWQNFAYHSLRPQSTGVSF